MKLSTLRNYVRAIGGDLQLMVTFPEGKAIKLRDIGTLKAARQRRKPIGRTARQPAAHVGRAPSR